jgi:hypothetical protein
MTPQAWYTYDDTTCNFGCQMCEYWWMGTAALTGIHKNRFEYRCQLSTLTHVDRGQSIKQEFKYATKAAFKKGDPKLYAMITVGQHPAGGVNLVCRTPARATGSPPALLTGSIMERRPAPLGPTSSRHVEGAF